MCKTTGQERVLMLSLLNVVSCDHFERISHITVGWSGTVHDNRARTTSKKIPEQDSYFSGKEYLLRDSAFKPYSRMMYCFKKPAGKGL